MSRYSETYLEIRKLRKKLRQIENLETLERDLDQYELEKVVEFVVNALVELLTLPEGVYLLSGR